MGSDRDEEKQEKRFKVVDRRRFTAEGDAREGVERAPEPAPVQVAPPSAQKPPAPSPAPKQAAPAPKPAPAAAPAGGAEGDDDATPFPFAAFLQSLAQQTLMCLGLMPYPSGHRELQLEAARDTIDILETLRIKTKGNLTDEEHQFMEGLLYELRMSYVEVARRVAAAQQAPGKGPPGPGRM